MATSRKRSRKAFTKWHPRRTWSAKGLGALQAGMDMVMEGVSATKVVVITSGGGFHGWGVNVTIWTLLRTLASAYAFA